MKAKSAPMQCALFAATITVAWLGEVASGQVVRDQTLGALKGQGLPAINGRIDITADLGTKVGGNLFHSFKQFDLQQGQTAVFTGPACITNVLTRVTGGQASTISGTLKTEGMSSANFYFINPAGVVFNSGARIDVPGSFAVTTADNVTLADGGVFHATDPARSVLTMASPQSFGFLSTRSASISVTGSNSELVVGSSRSISLVGENVSIRQGQVRAGDGILGGQINVVAIGRGEVAIQNQSGRIALEPAQLDAPGKITVSDGAKLSVDGTGDNQVFIRGGALLVESGTTVSEISAKSIPLFGGLPGRGIDIGLEDGLQLLGGKIIADATGPDGGPVIIHAAGDVALDNIKGFSEGGLIRAERLAVGNATGGDITITARSLTLTNGGRVNTSTLGEGAGGSIRITCDEFIHMRDGGTIFSQSPALNGGRSGDLIVKTNLLEIMRASEIATTTTGRGTAGNITVEVQTLRINGQGSTLFAGISSSSLGLNLEVPDASLGSAGNVTVTASHSVTLEHGSSIAAAARQGDAGTVTVSAGAILDVLSGSIIVARAGVIINEETGEIIKAQREFNGGDIEIIAADRVRISNSSIVALATGNGGNVRIDPQFIILNQSLILADSSVADAGTIDLQSRLFIASPVLSRVGDEVLFSDGSLISATSELGNAGEIRISAPEVDLSGKLLSLFAGLTDGEAKLPERCEVRLMNDKSTFDVRGRSGVPLSPEGWIPSIHLLD